MKDMDTIHLGRKRRLTKGRNKLFFLKIMIPGAMHPSEKLRSVDTNAINDNRIIAVRMLKLSQKPYQFSHA